jgi:hypothetical protein
MATPDVALATADLLYFTLFKEDGTECKDSDFTEMMPSLKTTTSTYFCAAVGPIELGEMRSLAFETLYTRIINHLMSVDASSLKPQNKFKKTTGGNPKFTYGANTTGDDYVDMMTNYGLNRKSLTSEKLKTSDIAMIKVLTHFYDLLYDDTMFIDQTASNATAKALALGKTTAYKIIVKKAIDCFQLVLNAKEVLDMGAIYAIIKHVVNHNYNITAGGNKIYTINSIIARAEKIATSAPMPDQIVTFIPTQYALFNHTTAKYPLLETSDGAAAKLTARLFAVLTDASMKTGVAQTFIMTSKYLFYISILFDEYIFNKVMLPIVDLPEKTYITNLYKILRSIKTMIPVHELHNIVVDIMFYLLTIKVTIDGKLINFIEHVKSQPNTKSITILPKWMCDCFNVAYFLAISIVLTPVSAAVSAAAKDAKIKELETQLLLLNWDSQCHDNKDDTYFRFICVFFFLKKIKFTPEFISLINRLFNYLNIEIVDDTKVTRFFELFKKMFKEEFSNLFPQASKLFEAFKPVVIPAAAGASAAAAATAAAEKVKTQKIILFYFLSCQNYKYIEDETLFRLLSDNTCYLFLKGVDPTGQNINCVPEMLIHINIGTPDVEQIQKYKDDYLNPYIIPSFAFIVIDLTIHYSMSLTNVPLLTNGTSEVCITALTRIDAASQREQPNSKYIVDDVKMSLFDSTPNIWKCTSSPAEFANIAGFIFKSPNINRISAPLLFPTTSIIISNPDGGPSIYLDDFFTDMMKISISEHVIFTKMGVKYLQIMDTEHTPKYFKNTNPLPQANQQYVFYPPLPLNSPPDTIIYATNNGFYFKKFFKNMLSDQDHIIKECIFPDKSGPIPDWDHIDSKIRPLDIFLSYFRELTLAVQTKIDFDKTHKPKPIKDVNFPSKLLILITKITLFFKTKILAIYHIYFYRYLKLIMLPWMDEKNCNFFSLSNSMTNINWDSYNFNFYSGGSVSNNMQIGGLTPEECENLQEKYKAIENSLLGTPSEIIFNNYELQDSYKFKNVFDSYGFNLNTNNEGNQMIVPMITSRKELDPMIPLPLIKLTTSAIRRQRRLRLEQGQEQKLRRLRLEQERELRLGQVVDQFESVINNKLRKKFEPSFDGNDVKRTRTLNSFLENSNSATEMLVEPYVPSSSIKVVYAPSSKKSLISSNSAVGLGNGPRTSSTGESYRSSNSAVGFQSFNNKKSEFQATLGHLLEHTDPKDYQSIMENTFTKDAIRTFVDQEKFKKYISDAQTAKQRGIKFYTQFIVENNRLPNDESIFKKHEKKRKTGETGGNPTRKNIIKKMYTKRKRNTRKRNTRKRNTRKRNTRKRNTRKR